MKLVISLTTRGRPQQVIDTVSRSLPNLYDPDTRVIIQVDDDDTETIRALNTPPWTDKRVSVHVAPREDTVAGKVNRAMNVPADLYMQSSDDDPQLTPGYDLKIIEAASRFDDGIGWVWGNFANLTFPSSIAVTAKVVEKVGYIWPEFFPYWFADHWILDTSKICGRWSCADIGTDQSKAGRTQELREPAWWATWFDAAYLKRRKEAHSIINGQDFKATGNQKKILLNGHRWIEQYSHWVNDSVRQQARQLEAWSGHKPLDERYKRVKQKAIDLVPHLLDDFGMASTEAQMFRNLLTPPSHIVSLPRAYG